MAPADKDKLMADLSAYLDGELSPQRVRQVEQLLAESEEARRTLDELRAISERLAALPHVPAPEGLPETIRHEAEQITVSRRRPTVRRARVLRLVAQLSASAALIAVGVFASWMVFEHRQAAPVPTVQRDPAVEKTAAPTTEVREKLARGYVPEAPVASAGEDKQANAPAVVMVDQLEELDFKAPAVRAPAPATPVEESVPGYAGGSTAEKGTLAVEGEAGWQMEGAAVTLGVPVSEVTPAVNLVITPRDVDEYNGSLRTMAQWQVATPATAGQWTTDTIAADADAGERWAGGRVVAGYPSAGATPTQQDFSVQVPPSEFNALLLSLDEQAPGRVQAVLKFSVRDIAQVQRLVRPTARAPRRYTPPAAAEAPPPLTAGEEMAHPESPMAGTGLAERTDQLDVERHAGRGGGFRGRVIRATPGARPAGSTEEQESGRRERLAEPEPEPAKDTLRRLEARGYVGESKETGEAADKISPDKKQDLAERRGAPTSVGSSGAPARPAAELPEAVGGRDVAGQAPAATPGASKRGSPPARPFMQELYGFTTQLREQLVDTCELMLGVAFRTQSQAAQPAPAPITLHVRVLPPPAPTTQPTASEETPEDR